MLQCTALAPWVSNTCKYPNPEDVSTLRMEKRKWGKVSNTSEISSLCSPEEISKLTPIAFLSCPVSHPVPASKGM